MLSFLLHKIYGLILLCWLLLGPAYIRPNQSALRPYHQQQKIIEKEENDIMNKIKEFLSENHHIPRSLPIFKQYATQLHDCLMQRYMTPLPFIDQIRTRREFHIVKLIRQKLKKAKLILRETDKSGVLHIGRASDYKRKAAIYRSKTGAYVELSHNPFDDIFNKVVRLLNNLKSNKQILEWQRVKMMPVRDKTELAYKYFLPKAHKVNEFLI